MSKSFGTDFIIVNDVLQPIPQITFKRPDGTFRPAMHHATIVRGFDEYILFSNPDEGKIWIEKVDRHRASFALRQIEDDKEWAELVMFCQAAGLLSPIGSGKYASNGKASK